MALSRIGSATGTTSLTMPSHAAGDLLIAFAYRDQSGVVPTAPAGWTQITSGLGSANTNGAHAWKKVAASSGEVSGTWTNATTLIIEVWRSDAGGPPRVGATAQSGGSSATITYPALSLHDTSGASTCLRFAGHRTARLTAANMVPTGYTLAQSAIDATDSAISCTAAGVTSVGSATKATGGASSGFRAISIEIRDYAAPPAGPASILQSVGHQEYAQNPVQAFASDVTDGSTLLLFLQTYSAPNVDLSGISDDRGNVWTRLATSASAFFGSGSVQLWAAVGAAPGPTTVTVNTTQYSNGFLIVEVTGMDPAGVYAANQEEGQTGNPPTVGPTATSAAAGLAFAMEAPFDGGAGPWGMVAPSGWTAEYAANGPGVDRPFHVSSKVISAAAAQSVTWGTFSGAPWGWAALIAAFPDAPSGGGGGSAKPATALLAAAGTVVAVARRSRAATAALSATGTLSAVAGRLRAAAATLTAAGTLLAAGARSRAASATLSATGLLTAQAGRSRAAQALLAAVGTLTALASKTGSANAAAALTLQGTLSATARRSRAAAASLAAQGTLAAAARRSRGASAVLGAATTLVAVARRTRGAKAALQATGTLAAAAARRRAASALLTAQGALSALGRAMRGAKATLTAAGTLIATGTRRSPGIQAPPGRMLAVESVGTRLATEARPIPGQGTVAESATPRLVPGQAPAETVAPVATSRTTRVFLVQ